MVSLLQESKWSNLVLKLTLSIKNVKVGVNGVLWKAKSYLFFDFRKRVNFSRMLTEPNNWLFYSDPKLVLKCWDGRFNWRYRGTSMSYKCQFIIYVPRTYFTTKEFAQIVQAILKLYFSYKINSTSRWSYVWSCNKFPVCFNGFVQSYDNNAFLFRGSETFDTWSTLSLTVAKFRKFNPVCTYKHHTVLEDKKNEHDSK